MIWRHIELQSAGPILAAALSRGPWYWVNVGYGYSLLLLGALLLVQMLVRRPAPYRRQAGVLLVGAIVPWVGDMLWVLGWHPFTHLDLTPFAFTVSGLVLAWGLFRFRLLDLVPVARDTVIESMGDGVIVLDDQGRIVDLNPAAARLVGRTAGQVVGQPVHQALAALPTLALRCQEATEAQEEITLGEGEAQRTFDLNISPLRDRRDRLTGRLIVLRDVTERRQAEESLRQSEANLLAAQHVGRIGNWTADLEMDKLHWSDQVFRILGIEPQRPTLELMAAAIHPKDRERVLAAIETHVEQQTPLDFVARIVRPDGEIRYVHDRAEVIRGQAGQAAKSLGTVQDITERVLAEQELRRLKDFNEGIVQSMVEGIAVEDAEGYFTFTNPAAADLLGYTVEELTGQHWTAIVPPDQQPLVQAADERRMRGQPDRYELALVRKDGARLPVLVSGSPRFDPKTGEFAGALAVFTDISEQKGAEEKLRASEERYRSLYSMVRLMCDNVPDMIWAKDLEKRYLFANQAICDKLLNARDTDEPIGKTDMFFAERERDAHPENPDWHSFGEICADSDAVVMRSRQPQRFDEFGNVRGEFLFLDVYKAPFWNQEGELIGTVGCGRIVTREKEIEKQQEETREALRRRTEQLEALRQVGLEIAAQLDLDALLHSIVSRADELVGGVIGGFYLYRPDREVLEVVVAIGVEPAVVGLTLHPGEGLAGRVWQSGEPLVVEDYRRWEGRAAVFDDQDFRATVGVPVRWGDEFLGVLDVVADAPGVFSASDAELLSLFATQAAIAIQNARLFQEAQQRLRELTILFETSAAVSVSLDVDAVLEATARQITSSLGIEGCAISAWDRAQDALVTLLDYAPDLAWWEPDEPGTVYHLADYPSSRRVLTERRPLAMRVSDPDADPIGVAWMKNEGLKSLLMVPLVVRGEAVGYLELMESREEREFTATEIALCQTLANQAAAALENARLFQAEREQRELAEVLREAAQVVGASLDLREILGRILEQLKRVLVYDTASVVIFREGGVPDLVVGLGYADERMTSREASKLLGDSSILRRMARDLRPVVSADVRHLEGWIWVPGAEHVRSWLCVPLVAHGRMIGALMVDHSQPGFFGPAELHIVQALAQHAAQAIENARLYEAEQRQAREAAAVSAIAQALNATTDLASVFQVVARHLARVVEFDRLSVALVGDGEGQFTMYALAAQEDAPLATGVTLPQAATAAAVDVLAGRPHLTPDLSVELDFAAERALYESGLRSRLNLPLLLGETVIGALNLASYRPHAFSLDQLPLLTQIANAVAAAVQNARLEEERRRLEEQFRQAQKMEALGRLAGGVAHDFNNLLTVVNLSTQILQRKLHPEDPLLEHVRPIREAGERGARLTRQLLSFSRREVIQPCVLNLNRVVGDLSRMLRRLLGEDIHLTMTLADDLWPVRADPSQIDQVLLNLAVNARDAMPGGGSLTIETANVVLDQAYAAFHLEVQPGEHVRLAVSDTGTGMDEAVQARIFEPFFTTKARGQGTGLGLATVFGIVKQNGGHIEVYSEVGQGTTFKIYLPRTAGSAPSGDVGRAGDDLEPRMASLERGHHGTETVLLVEDDAPVRELAVRVLESCGYRVLVAGDGLQALQIGHEHDGPIHLLLTDVVMPHMHGQELAEQLQLARSEMRVLYMSGYTDDAIARHGVLAPGVAFLPKPFTVEDLARRVREALDSPA